MTRELVVVLGLALIILISLTCAALSSPWPNLEKRKRALGEAEKDLREFRDWLKGYFGKQAEDLTKKDHSN